MGLCYDTSKWSDYLWDSHVDQSLSSRTVLDDGKEKQPEFESFAHDIHSRLYLLNEPSKVENGPEWATKLHEAASELNEWQQLRKRCHNDGFLSSLAAEQVLQSLIRFVPRAKSEDKENQGQNQPGNQGNPGQGQPGNGNAQGTNGTGQGNGQSNQVGTSGQPGNGNGSVGLRRALRKAIREATDAVCQAQGQLEGVQEALGLPGTAPSANATIKDIDRIRDAHKRISSSYRLKQIAELAGRLQRLAATKKRSKIKPAVGCVKGITLSGDIARVLPTELAGLRGSKLARLDSLRKIVEKRALSYQMEGEETSTRGPIVILADESGSMNGERETWSKAVALSILSTATQQKRAWHLIGFSGHINHEQSIKAGEGTASTLEQALCRACSGGTDFTQPVARALDILEDSETMKKADVIIITDGEAELDKDVAERARQMTKSEGINFFVVGIGDEAALSSLRGIATSMVKLNTFDTNDPITPVINLEVE